MEMRRARGFWLVLALTCAAAPGCPLSGLFQSTGSACSADANCPGAQACCAGVCQSKCDAGTAIVTSITLSTDYIPGYEFDEVRVALDDDERGVEANVTSGFFAAAPVGQFAEVDPAREHTVSVSLRKSGAVIAHRDVAFASSDDVTVPMVFSRDGNETACATDVECRASVACARGVCASGVCLQRRDDEACGADERCVPDLGCVARETECREPADCEDNYLCTHESCTLGRCVVTPDGSLCNGTLCAPNAFDADPVSGCTTEPFLLFACADGQQTTRLQWRCDGSTTCDDFSDETECGYGLFTCTSGIPAIRADWRCDGFVNCPDQSDETSCGDPVFVCADGVHVTRLAWVCDGSSTCPDFSDEAGCGYTLFTCASGLRAVRSDWQCDGFINCEDHSDETTCGFEIFVCADGHVTRREWQCDGSTTCPDYSDEQGCGYALFVCANGSYAIRADWRCDGTANCGDASDEAGCP